MAQAQDSNDRDREIDRQLRGLNRRVERLEDTQITGGELNRGFDRVYGEIDALRSEFAEFRNEMNQKLDTILRHLTGID